MADTFVSTSPSAAVPAPQRVVFRTAVTQRFFDLPKQDHARVMEAFGLARSDLKERFGIRILGTFDDDRLCVGAPSAGEWTSFFLADVPDLAAAIAFCDQFRSTPVGSDGELLWKYAHIEARIGRAQEFEKQ